MALTEAILAVALSLPSHAGKEREEDYAYRLGIISSAIAHAAEATVCTDESTGPCWPGDAPELASVLLELGYAESGFARSVHLGGARKDVGGWAISLWSLHSWTLVPYAEWRTLGGFDGTERSAVAAARVVSWARQRCRSTYGAISLYATGKSCTWQGARQRARMARRFTARIRWRGGRPGTAHVQCPPSPATQSPGRRHRSTHAQPPPPARCWRGGPGRRHDRGRCGPPACSLARLDLLGLHTARTRSQREPGVPRSLPARHPAPARR
jgi:hypothetical protein